MFFAHEPSFSAVSKVLIYWLGLGVIGGALQTTELSSNEKTISYGKFEITTGYFDFEMKTSSECR